MKQKQSMIKDFARDLFRYIPSQAVPGIFSIFIIPVFTRLFNPDEYGQYVIVMSTISVLGIIATTWINTSIVRFYAGYEKLQLNLFNGTIIKLMSFSVIIISFTAFLILLIFRKSFNPLLYYYLNIGLLIFIFGSIFGVMLEMLVVKRKPNHYSLISIWRQCVCILIGIGIAVLYNMSIAGLLWGILIGIVIMLPILYRITFGKCNFKEYSPLLRTDIMRYGFPLIATNLAAWILSLSDRYIIELFRGSHEVGLYSISYSLTDHSIQLISSLIILSSAPIVMKLWKTKGPDETSLFIKDLTRYYIIITLPAAVGLSLLAKPILKLLATQSFYEGYQIVPLVAASIFVFGLQRNFQLGLLFYKKTHLIMYILLASGLINIVLNIYFVPIYGFIAAGYTTLFSYIIFAILMIFISRRYFIFQFPFITLSRVLVSVMLMSIVVLYILGLNLESVIATVLLSIVFGIVVYFILLIIMKEIDRDFLKNIYLLFEKPKERLK